MNGQGSDSAQPLQPSLGILRHQALKQSQCISRLLCQAFPRLRRPFYGTPIETSPPFSPSPKKKLLKKFLFLRFFIYFCIGGDIYNKHLGKNGNDNRTTCERRNPLDRGRCDSAIQGREQGHSRERVFLLGKVEGMGGTHRLVQPQAAKGNRKGKTKWHSTPSRGSRRSSRSRG